MKSKIIFFSLLLLFSIISFSQTRTNRADVGRRISKKEVHHSRHMQKAKQAKTAARAETPQGNNKKEKKVSAGEMKPINKK